MTFCSEPGCGVLVETGRCPTHAPRALTRPPWYADVQVWYRSTRWRRLRGDVLRCDPFCHMCGSRGRRTVSTDVDHVVPHHGDPVRFWDAGNLQALCRSCHSAKTVRGA